MHRARIEISIYGGDRILNVYFFKVAKAFCQIGLSAGTMKQAGVNSDPGLRSIHLRAYAQPSCFLAESLQQLEEVF